MSVKPEGESRGLASPGPARTIMVSDPSIPLTVSRCQTFRLHQPVIVMRYLPLYRAVRIAYAGFIQELTEDGRAWVSTGGKCGTLAELDQLRPAAVVVINGRLQFEPYRENHRGTASDKKRVTP